MAITKEIQLRTENSTWRVILVSKNEIGTILEEAIPDATVCRDPFGSLEAAYDAAKFYASHMANEDGSAIPIYNTSDGSKKQLNTTVRPMSHENFVNILHQTCPERIDEINSVLSRNNIAIEDTTNSPCGSDIFIYPATGNISFGCADWPYLFSFTYGIFSKFEALRTWIEYNPGNENPPLVLTATWDKLIAWSLTRNPAGQPSNVPHPASRDTTSTLAMDIGILAIGYVLLHEIGHAEGNHDRRGNEDPHDLEHEADRYAYLFITAQASQYANSTYPHTPNAEERVLRKRILAALIFSTWIIYLEHINGGYNPSGTHPSAKIRLLTVINNLPPNVDAEKLCCPLAIALNAIGLQHGLMTPPESSVELVRAFLSP